MTSDLQCAFGVTMEGNNTVDIMFGMSAVRDTRAMDLARYKNKTQQMILEKQHTRLEQEFKHKISKIDLDLELTRKFYRDIDPDSKKSIVCARGLSYEQKQSYREIRQKSQLSISLEEFDKRISDYRSQMDFVRYGGRISYHQQETGSSPSWEFSKIDVTASRQDTSNCAEKYIPLLPRNRTFIPHEILYGSKISLKRQKTNISKVFKRPLILTMTKGKRT